MKKESLKLWNIKAKKQQCKNKPKVACYVLVSFVLYNILIFSADYTIF